MFSSLILRYTNFFIEQCQTKSSRVLEKDLKAAIGFYFREIIPAEYVAVQLLQSMKICHYYVIFVIFYSIVHSSVRKVDKKELFNTTKEQLERLIIDKECLDDSVTFFFLLNSNSSFFIFFYQHLTESVNLFHYFKLVVQYFHLLEKSISNLLSSILCSGYVLIFLLIFF